MKLLVDADSLIYHCACKEGINNLEEVQEDFIIRVSNMLHATSSKEFVLFFTGRNSFRNYRATRRPYKGNRPDLGKVFPFLGVTKDWAKNLPCSYACKVIEADDAVAIMHTELKEDTMIASPDKDVLYQNAGVHLDYRTMKKVRVSKKQANYFLHQQWLTGDATDNIPGIEQVGVKKAQAALDGSKDFATTVFQEYIKKYNLKLGVKFLAETFDLVYLLKSYEDLKQVDTDGVESLESLEFSTEVLLNENA